LSCAREKGVPIRLTVCCYQLPKPNPRRLWPRQHHQRPALRVKLCGARSGRRCSPNRGSAMYQVLRLTIAAMAFVFAILPTSAPARVAATQIKLTEKQVEEFIAAQRDMSAVVEKMMQGAVSSKSAITKYEAELKAATKRHGFKNFAEYEAVAAS